MTGRGNAAATWYGARRTRTPQPQLQMTGRGNAAAEVVRRAADADFAADFAVRGR
jgi:hypothetical protein